MANYIIIYFNKNIEIEFDYLYRINTCRTTLNFVDGYWFASPPPHRVYNNIILIRNLSFRNSTSDRFTPFVYYVVDCEKNIPEQQPIDRDIIRYSLIIPTFAYNDIDYYYYYIYFQNCSIVPIVVCLFFVYYALSK